MVFYHCLCTTITVGPRPVGDLERYALKTTIGENMKDIFPSPITNLPEADIQLEGITAYLSQAETHQILFMRFDKDADLPEHYHDAQIGVVLEGKIELTIGGEKKTYTKGDRYYIPKGVKHSGKIFAGYADITFFNEPSRYSKKTNKNEH